MGPGGEMERLSRAASNTLRDSVATVANPTSASDSVSFRGEMSLYTYQNRPESSLGEILTTLKLTYRWSMSPKESHQRI